MQILNFLLVYGITVVGSNKFVNIVDQMLAGDGLWILAAAGTTGVRPPWESCVRVKIKYTGFKSDCTVVFHNHTFSKVRIISYHGINEANITEIRSKGPTHQYMIKTMDKNYAGEIATPAAFKNEISYNAAVNSAICWYGGRERPLEWRYVIMPLNTKYPIDVFFLIGVRARIQAPEYQIGIFSKGILDEKYIKDLMDKINYRTRKYFQPLCMSDQALHVPKYIPGNWFPPYCMPKVYMKCAKGYDILDETHPYNVAQAKEHEIKQHNKVIPTYDGPGYRYDQTSSIWVKHQ